MNERTQDHMHYADALLAIANQLGEQMYDKYMGGANDYRVDVSQAAYVLARIYFLDLDTVKMELELRTNSYFTWKTGRENVTDRSQEKDGVWHIDGHKSDFDPNDPNGDRHVQYTDWDFGK